MKGKIIATWQHRRAPRRSTAGPNVYPSLELPGVGARPDSSRSSLHGTDS